MISRVAFEWAMRDIVQGKRGLGLLLAAAFPTLFLSVVALMVDPVPASEAEEVTAIIVTSFIMPPIVAIMALFVGGAVLRQPIEDGTIVYMLTRPVKRMQVGMSRCLAIALTVSVATAVSGGLLIIALGELRLILGAMPGLLVGGFALGALYGFILSLHKFAIGGVLIHAIYEGMVARVPFDVRLYTVSWHAWGWMGEATRVASREGLIFGNGGNGLVAILMGVLAIVLTGLWVERRAFHLNLGEQ